MGMLQQRPDRDVTICYYVKTKCRAISRTPWITTSKRGSSGTSGGGGGGLDGDGGRPGLPRSRDAKTLKIIRRIS